MTSTPSPALDNLCSICGASQSCLRCMRARSTGRTIRPLRRTKPVELVGTVVGERYAVTALLGEGGMGGVLAGHDITSGAEVAIKVLSPSAYNLVNLRRFKREAKAATALSHPNLCRVYDHGLLANGAPYMTMELLSGETLSTRLRSMGALELGDVVSIMLQLLAGLSAVHAAGILHRDVKPANVFVTTPRGRLPTVKLIDLGLAKVLPTCTLEAVREEANTITRTDLIPGTPFYLAPEQIVGDVEVDERVDVWAAGLTLYEMLAGQKAYRADSRDGIMARIIFDVPAPIESLRKDLPPELVAIIAKATAKDRDARFRTASEFRKALLEAWATHRARGVARAGQLYERDATPQTIPRPLPLQRGSTAPTIRDTMPTMPRQRGR